MKTTRIVFTAIIAFSTLTLAQAQQSIDDMVKEWERAKAYTKEYMEAMSESGYALKPTPEMRSYAEQMLHLTDANYRFASAVTGEKIPAGLSDLEKTTTDKSKANVTNLVMGGYDYMISSIKKMTPAQLSEKTMMFNKFEMTKGMALAKVFEHQTHHRGQTTVYLRMAGVKPPQEKLF